MHTLSYIGWEGFVDVQIFNLMPAFTHISDIFLSCGNQLYCLHLSVFWKKKLEANNLGIRLEWWQNKFWGSQVWVLLKYVCCVQDLAKLRYVCCVHGLICFVYVLGMVWPVQFIFVLLVVWPVLCMFYTWSDLSNVCFTHKLMCLCIFVPSMVWPVLCILHTLIDLSCVYFFYTWSYLSCVYSVCGLILSVYACFAHGLTCPVCAIYIVWHVQLSDWMKEKYQTATDESYRDLTNIPAKLQKHQAFEAELKANNDRLKDLNKVCICGRQFVWQCHGVQGCTLSLSLSLDTVCSYALIFHLSLSLSVSFSLPVFLCLFVPLSVSLSPVYLW